MEEYGINKQIRLGYKRRGVSFKVFGRENWITNIFRETEYITNIKNAPKQLRTNYGKINKVEKFKYVGEIVQFIRTEREPNQ